MGILQTMLPFQKLDGRSNISSEHFEFVVNIKF